MREKIVKISVIISINKHEMDFLQKIYVDEFNIQ